MAIELKSSCSVFKACAITLKSVKPPCTINHIWCCQVYIFQNHQMVHAGKNSSCCRWQTDCPALQLVLEWRDRWRRGLGRSSHPDYCMQLARALLFFALCSTRVIVIGVLLLTLKIPLPPHSSSHSLRSLTRRAAAAKYKFPPPFLPDRILFLLKIHSSLFRRKVDLILYWRCELNFVIFLTSCSLKYSVHFETPTSVLLTAVHTKGEHEWEEWRVWMKLWSSLWHKSFLQSLMNLFWPVRCCRKKLVKYVISNKELRIQ